MGWYYRVAFEACNANLVRPSPFWADYLPQIAWFEVRTPNYQNCMILIVILVRNHVLQIFLSNIVYDSQSGKLAEFALGTGSGAFLSKSFGKASNNLAASKDFSNKPSICRITMFSLMSPQFKFPQLKRKHPKSPWESLFSDLPSSTFRSDPRLREPLWHHVSAPHSTRNITKKSWNIFENIFRFLNFPGTWYNGSSARITMTGPTIILSKQLLETEYRDSSLSISTNYILASLEIFLNWKNVNFLNFGKTSKFWETPQC